MKKIISSTLLTLSFTPFVFAQDTHIQHGAHEHGSASLNIVQEGKQIIIALETPAMNVLGFEHAPSTDAHFATINHAKASLLNANALFELSKKAKCQFVEADIESELFEAYEDHHDEHHDDEHEEDHHDEHHDDEHEDDHEEGHHDEHKGETHSDVDVTWEFTCKSPKKLKQLQVNLAEYFPSFYDIDAQYILQNKQGVMELEGKKNVIKF